MRENPPSRTIVISENSSYEIKLLKAESIYVAKILDFARDSLIIARFVFEKYH